MQHLARILAVVVPLTAAAGSTVLATPAVVDFLKAHPADAGYLALAAGVGHAVYKAYRDWRASQAPVPPPSAGSETMGAK